MGLADGEHAMIRDDAPALAEAVVGLYGDAGLWQRLSDRGRERVEEYFPPRAAGEVIDRSIRSLAGGLEKTA